MPPSHSNSTTERIMRLLEFTDSTLPVGMFSFSNGLESAAAEGIVTDAATLEEFTAAVAAASATSDGVGAIAAYRAMLDGNLKEVRRADRMILQSKLNAEARRMMLRTGRKLAQLAVGIIDDERAHSWLGEVLESRARGSYPAVHGVLFAACGISEKALFCSHQYGVITTVLNAALKIVKVSHFDTQAILYRLGGESEELYDRVKDYSLDDMHAFAPQAELLASLHEKGEKRIFMN